MVPPVSTVIVFITRKINFFVFQQNMRYRTLLTKYEILVVKYGFLKSSPRFVVGIVSQTMKRNSLRQVKGILIFVVHISDVASYQS